MLTSCYNIIRVKVMDCLEWNGSMSSFFVLAAMLGKTYFHAIKLKITLTG